MNSIQILEKLISFDTVSSNSNLEIISYCEKILKDAGAKITLCLLYTSPSPRDGLLARMPSSA